MMRLFVAVDLPDQVVSNLERLIAGLRPAARINWSTPSNLHITLKFIGEWPAERLEEVNAALREVAAAPGQQPIPIDIKGLGYFPNSQSPRVFWAAVNAPPALAELARRTEDALAKLGIEPEKRAFSPHLTLARIKTPVPLADLRQAVANLPSLDFGSFTANRFYLYQSTLRPTGSIYTRLSEFVFARA